MAKTADFCGCGTQPPQQSRAIMGKSHNCPKNRSFLRLAELNFRSPGSKFRKRLKTASRNLRNLSPPFQGGSPLGLLPPFREIGGAA